MFDIVWCIDVILTQRPLSCVCIQISNRVFRVTQKTCSLNWHFEIVLIMIKFEQCAAACSCRCVINFIKVYSLFCLHYKCQYLWFRRLRPTHTQTTEKNVRFRWLHDVSVYIHNTPVRHTSVLPTNLRIPPVSSTQIIKWAEFIN